MEIKTFFLVAHLVGLIVGLGSVTTLDFYLIRLLKGARVSDQDLKLITLVSKLGAAGLLILWLSGIGFLTLLWMKSPDLLTNPKVHAKIVVVTILTINGVILETVIFPRLRGSIGRPIFGPYASKTGAWPLRLCVTISAASWWTAFTLGALRELNFAASMTTFLGAYLVAVAAMAVGMLLLEFAIAYRNPANFNQLFNRVKIQMV